MRSLAEIDGCSAKEISVIFKVTRNMVVGICRRRGIRLRSKAGPRNVAVGPKPSKPLKAPKVKSNWNRLRNGKPPPKTEPTAGFLPPIPEPKVATMPIHLVELNSHTCRWPLWPHTKVSAEKHLFCGDTPRVGSSYCAEHSLIAFAKPREAVGKFKLTAFHKWDLGTVAVFNDSDGSLKVSKINRIVVN